MCWTNPISGLFSLHIPPLKTMNKPAVNRQLAFDDFNQPCGMQLDPRNEWCILAGMIDWSTAEGRYVACFKSGMMHPPVPLRQAMGALIIQKRMGLSKP